MIADVIGRAAISGEPKRVGPALVLATVVTLVAVVPLGIVAWQARSDGPVGNEGLTVTVGTGAASDLAGQVLPAGTDAVRGIDDPDLVAASWVLYDAAGNLLAEGRHVGSPPFTLDLAPGTMAGLDPGLYDLLVTATEGDGTVVERGARFAVGDTE